MVVEVVAAVATHLATIEVRVAIVVLIFLAIVVACRPPLGDTGVTPKNRIM